MVPPVISRRFNASPVPVLCGGVYIGNGNATLTNVNITGNTANQGGGLFGTGPVSLKDCSITGNTATYGGGLRFGPLSMVTMDNSQVTGNGASYGGGWVSVSPQTVQLRVLSPSSVQVAAVVTVQSP